MAEIITINVAILKNAVPVVHPCSRHQPQRFTMIILCALVPLMMTVVVIELFGH